MIIVNKNMNNILHIRNIPFDTNKNDLKNYLKEQTKINIDDLKINMPLFIKNNKVIGNKGYCHVEFINCSTANNFLQEFNNKLVIKERVLKLQFSNKFNKITIKISNLPINKSENDFLNYLKKIKYSESIKIIQFPKFMTHMKNRSCILLINKNDLPFFKEQTSIKLFDESKLSINIYNESYTVRVNNIALDTNKDDWIEYIKLGKNKTSGFKLYFPLNNSNQTKGWFLIYLKNKYQMTQIIKDLNGATVYGKVINVKECK